MFRELNLSQHSSVESTGSSVVTRRIVHTCSSYTHAASHEKLLDREFGRKLILMFCPLLSSQSLGKCSSSPSRSRRKDEHHPVKFFCVSLFCFVFQFARGKQKRGERCVHECSHFSSPPRVIIQVVIEVKFWKSVFFCLSLFG